MSDKPCIFCSIDSSSIIAENDSVIAFEDKYPVTPNHLLVIPRTHRKDFFDLTTQEAADLHAMLHELKTMLSQKDKTISGFNIGANCGTSAGQTVFHCHIHLIPRRDGDTENPTGGVRGVIPSKQKY